MSVSFMGCSHTVTIRSEPAGAEIFVDGQSKGVSPVTFSETSSGGGTVAVKAKLDGREVTKVVDRSELNWSAVGGAGGGSGAAACLAMNTVGCGAFIFVGIFALPINACGLLLLPVGPAIAYFVGGKQLPDNVTVDMRSAALGPPGANDDRLTQRPPDDVDQAAWAVPGPGAPSAPVAPGVVY